MLGVFILIVHTYIWLNPEPGKKNSVDRNMYVNVQVLYVQTGMYEKGLQYNIIISSISSSSISISISILMGDKEREREDREGFSDHFRSDGQKGLFVKFPNLNWLSQEKKKKKRKKRSKTLSLYIHTYI